MKATFLTVILIICSCCFAQDTSLHEDEILYNKAIALQEVFLETNVQELFFFGEKNKTDFGRKIRKEILKVAIDNYNKIISDFPKSKFLFDSFSHKAHIEYEFQNISVAKEYFKKVLEFETNEKGYYKNLARLNLAEIAIEENEYNLALKYLDESKEKFKPFFDCGNAKESYELRFKRLYENTKKGLAKKQ